MTEPLRFEDVRIDRVYGTHFDLRLPNLSAHLNIIFGPNGAGKTTIANALNGLLLPSAGRKISLSAEATVRYGHRTLHLDVKNAREECRIGGQLVDRSKLPQFLRPKSYHLPLQELLPEKTGDGDLAQDIIKQANGGFDIVAAGKKLEFNLQKRYNKTSEAKEFESASRKLKEVVQEQRALREQRRRRTDFLNELDAAKRATERVTLIEKIQKWHNAESEYKRASDIAHAYPSVIRSSRDLTNVAEIAQKLANSIHELKKEIDQRGNTIHQVQKNLEQNRLAPNGLEAGELKLLSSQVRDCSGKYRELEQLQETLEASRRQRNNAWKNLGGHLPPESEPRFSREELKRLQEYARDSGRYIQKTQALKELKSLLESIHHKDSSTNDKELQDAQQIVQRWILVLENSSPQQQRINLLLWITIITSALLSLVAGISMHPIGYSGLLITVLTWSIRTLLRSDTGQNISPAQKSHLKRLLPELPQNPDTEGLQLGLEQLLEKRSRSQLEELKANELIRTERLLKNLAEEKSDLETRKQKLVDSIHLSPSSDIISLIDLVDRILHWRDMDSQTKELANKCENVSINYTNLLEKIKDTFAEYDYERPADPRNAEKLLDQLRQDDDAAKRDSDRLEQEKIDLETTRNRLKDQELEYDKIFTELELNSGNLAGLADCARQFANWTEAQKNVDELRIRSESLDPRQDIPQRYTSLLQIEDLETELISAQQESAREKGLQEQLTRLDANIERAEQGNSLENALAETENKRVALEQVREEKAAKAVGQAVLNRLREDAIKNAPPVFECAQKNFEQVTDGRYTLVIPHDDSFRAKDNERKRDFDLTELSSATRVQLLLSVRLAFVETQESNYRFPITLDETLANSDDKRALAIIKTISTLASDRQIFYFTAQQDEVDKWRKFVPEDRLKVHSIG